MMISFSSSNKYNHLMTFRKNFAPLLDQTNRPHGDNSGQQPTSRSAMVGAIEEAWRWSVTCTWFVTNDVADHSLGGITAPVERVRRRLRRSHALYAKLSCRKRSVLELWSIAQHKVKNMQLLNPVIYLRTCCPSSSRLQRPEKYSSKPIITRDPLFSRKFMQNNFQKLTAKVPWIETFCFSTMTARAVST